MKTPRCFARRCMPVLGLGLLATPSRADRPSEPQTIVAVAVDAAQRQREYAQGVAAFEAMKASRAAGIKNDENLPFQYFKGEKTQRAVLMIHGLSDSPHYMKELGAIFSGEGYNVIGILLPKHGTKPEALFAANLEEWRAEVQRGLEIASKLGDEVSIAGYSMGGALTLDAVVNNYPAQPSTASSGRVKLGDIFLFAPALRLANQKAALCTRSPSVADFVIRKLKIPWATKKPDSVAEDHPYRYRKMASKAACEIFRLTEDNNDARSRLLSQIARNRIGVFAVQADTDRVVVPQGAVAFMSRLPPNIEPTFVHFPSSVKIDHNWLTVRQDIGKPPNPGFDRIERELRAYLQKNVRRVAFFDGRTNRSLADAAGIRALSELKDAAAETLGR